MSKADAVDRRDKRHGKQAAQRAQKQKAQGERSKDLDGAAKTSAKEYREQTLALYRAAWTLDPAVISEEQNSPQGRLACILSFIKTLVCEVLQNESSPFVQEDHPRLRLAFEAYRMLECIKDNKRSLLDEFYAGGGIKGAPSHQIDKHVEAILAACILRLEKLNPDVDRSDIYRWMRGNDGLAPHMGNDPTLTTMYHEHKRTKGGQSEFFRELYAQQQIDDTETVIERAASDVSLRKDPLSMDWATKLILRSATYSDTRGNTLALSAEDRRQLLYGDTSALDRPPNVSTALTPVRRGLADQSKGTPRGARLLRGPGAGRP